MEENVSTSAEIVHSSVDVSILKVVLSQSIAVVSILEWAQVYTFTNGVITFILQGNGTSGSSTFVVIERVF